MVGIERTHPYIAKSRKATVRPRKRIADAVRLRFLESRRNLNLWRHLAFPLLPKYASRRGANVAKEQPNMLACKLLWLADQTRSPFRIEQRLLGVAQEGARPWVDARLLSA